MGRILSPGRFKTKLVGRSSVTFQGHQSFLLVNRCCTPGTFAGNPSDWWKQPWFPVQIFHDFSDSNTKPRPKRQPCSQWLAGTVDLSESEIFDVGFEAEIGRGMRQISPFVCRIFFGKAPKCIVAMNIILSHLILYPVKNGTFEYAALLVDKTNGHKGTFDSGCFGSQNLRRHRWFGQGSNWEDSMKQWEHA